MRQHKHTHTHTHTHAHAHTVSSARLQSGSPDEEEGAKYAGVESLEALQGGIGQIQQEHERLMGTVAHLSHELGISKEHIKVERMEEGREVE